MNVTPHVVQNAGDRIAAKGIAPMHSPPWSLADE